MLGTVNSHVNGGGDIDRSASQDLTQEFFIRVWERRYLDRADLEKGSATKNFRFRSFLLLP